MAHIYGNRNGSFILEFNIINTNKTKFNEIKIK